MVCKLVAANRGRNAIHDYIWSPIFDDIEEEEVTLGAIGHRGVSLAEIAQRNAENCKRAASAHVKAATKGGKSGSHSPGPEKGSQGR